MKSNKKPLIYIVILIIAFSFYGQLVKFIMKGDGSGTVAVVLLGLGWITFLYLLVIFIRQLFKKTETVDMQQTASPTVVSTAYSPASSGMSFNEKMLLLGIFIFYLCLIKASGRIGNIKYTDAMAISRTFGPYLWWGVSGCFLLGLGGKRIQTRVTGTTWGGTPVVGYIDHGSVEGTGGTNGAVALSFAYISVFVILVMISQWHDHLTWLNNTGTGVIEIIAGAFLMMLLYFVLVYQFMKNQRTRWIIIGVWASLLLIVAQF